jgi:hypothetical protein
MQSEATVDRYPVVPAGRARAPARSPRFLWFVSSQKLPSSTTPIRRCDVFAEYTRQEQRENGYPADEAKDYGIWLVKVVAFRRYGEIGSADGKTLGKKAEREGAHEAAPTFRSVADELQTDEAIRDTVRREAPHPAPAPLHRMVAGFKIQAITDLTTSHDGGRSSLGHTLRRATGHGRPPRQSSRGSGGIRLQRGEGA